MTLIPIPIIVGETGGIGNQRKNQDHTERTIVKI